MASTPAGDRIWWERADVPIRGALFDSADLSPDHPEVIRIQRLRGRLPKPSMVSTDLHRALSTT